MYNIVVPTFNQLTGIILSSYGYIEPLRKYNLLGEVFDQETFDSRNGDFFQHKSLLMNLPPWRNFNNWVCKQDIFCCYVTESTKIIPQQKEQLEGIGGVWVPSTFCKKVLEEEGISSILLPYSIEAPKRERIPENSEYFTFLVSFDGKYSICRKGVLDTIKSFQIAFEDNKKYPNVKLKIKTFNLNLRSRIQILQAISNDERIFLVDEEYLEPEQIYDGVSCYISLHKGEGFGRHIAESMYRGLLTIVTNYGGPTDFCAEDNCLLVSSGQLVEHKNACSQYKFDGLWFQPNLEESIEKLKEAYNMSEESKNIIKQKAILTIKEKYSNEAVEKYIEKIFY